ncbi:MAG: MBOAT family protein [Butyrivibrio sp.]|nr:MBOAT family protein [Butyrivibrio sp.]
MFFTSYEFLGFAALLFLAYYLIPKKYQWQLLLAASYIFYFIAGAEYLIYILVTTLTTYFAALKIEQNALRQSDYLKEHKEGMSKDEKRAYKDGCKKVRLRWLCACIILNIGILAVVKYTNFFISNVNGILNAFGNTKQLSFMTLALPMGISFYTFQAMGYLIDVYRGTVKAQGNPFKFALFVSFFPQLIQGPISRYGDLGASLYGEHAFDSKTVCYGLQRMLWGYFKKMVIADRVLIGVNTIIGTYTASGELAYQGIYVFVGMILYTLELYADFTGGIDITIGIAETMGITVKENFNRPYFSKSLKEYWRRWHISMCDWFRDYVFYPVSSSKAMQKFTKFSRKHFGEKSGRRLPVYVSSFVVWFATGIWHGASWNFIVWGLGNWAVLMVSEELEPLYARFHNRVNVGGKAAYKIFQIARTFLLVCVLNIFDCYPTLALTFKAIASMFNISNWKMPFALDMKNIGLTSLDYIIVAIGALVMLGVSLWQRDGSVREKIVAKPYPIRFIIWYGLFLVILLMGAYGTGYDASQFIYNRF